MSVNRILVTNDDGIEAEGLRVFVRLLRQYYGKKCDIWVCAPKEHNSAKSHSITLVNKLKGRRIHWEEDSSVHAYAVDGTPADCVTAALCGLMPEKPDLLYSGINQGANAGTDILYSGTIGAAMEGLIRGIPSIAFSLGRKAANHEVVEAYFRDIMDYLAGSTIESYEIWNVNFPQCSLLELRGILYDRIPDTGSFIQLAAMTCTAAEDDPDDLTLAIKVKETGESSPGTDMDALRHRYISIGKISNMILKANVEGHMPI
ncbi:MAG: 5'/3'-nucleotidase SurE [Lachnospiraceae bacterium]|nr:5'/3'-nucleotidase SurE [Lachnospiraceae bacterium]